MLNPKDFSGEELQKKREEAERKARRGEIDPMQEFTFTALSKVFNQVNIKRLCYIKIHVNLNQFELSSYLLFKITGLGRPSILNFMYEKPLILDELDLLYKGENNKLVIFYYQVTTKSFKVILDRYNILSQESTKANR